MRRSVNQQLAVSSRPAPQHIGTSFAPALLNIFKGLKVNSMTRLIVIKCALIFLSIVSFAGTVAAQLPGDTARPTRIPPVDMAGTMRSNGKIYVVVAVLVIILAGLFTYLTRLDRKITRLEKGRWKDA